MKAAENLIRGSTIALAAMLFAPSALAFTYPEHVVLTKRAWDVVTTTDAQEGRGALIDLKTLVEQPRHWPFAIEGDLPADKFHVADLVALAADHSTSPLFLLTRWFWWNDVPKSCGFLNFLDAIGSLDNSAESPAVCFSSEKSRRFAVNRSGFLNVVRSYHHGCDLMALSSTSGIDLRLASNDCAYTCMAERGRSHFRIPTLTTDDASTRHDFPNAAASYATNHAIALGLSMRSADKNINRELYRGLALVYESFALHYLQDGIAAGHIVSSHYGYGNISVSQTHDLVDRVGITVSIPPALCEDLKKLHAEPQAPGATPPPFPKLDRQCGLPAEDRHLVVRGDHAVAGHLTSVDTKTETDITEELTVFLSVMSALDVVRARRLNTWLVENPQYEAFFDDRYLSIVPPDLFPDSTSPSVVEKAVPTNLQSSIEKQEESSLTPTKKVRTFDQIVSAIVRSQNEFFLKHKDVPYTPTPAIAAWPTPLTPIHMEEAPGGFNWFIPLLVRTAALKRNDNLVSAIGLGGAYMATLYKYRVVAEGAAIVTYSSADAATTAGKFGFGLQGGLTVHWLKYGGLSALNSIQLTLEDTTRAAVERGNLGRGGVLTGMFTPFSYEMVSDLKSVHIGPVFGSGHVWGVDSGWFAFLGLSVGISYHTERSPDPIPAAEN